MVTLEQKLSLFSKLLQQDVNNEIGEKIQKMEKVYEEIVQEHKRKVDREARHIVEKAEKKGEEKRLELVSKAKMYTKKQGMLVKERYIDTLITKIEERVVAFTQTEAYAGYIAQLLHEIKGIDTEGVYVIYMTAEDCARYGDQVVAYLEGIGLTRERLSLQEKNTKMLGGFILENPEKNTRMDLSAYTVIQDHKDMIIEALFAAIGEVGENNA